MINPYYLGISEARKGGVREVPESVRMNGFEYYSAHGRAQAITASESWLEGYDSVAKGKSDAVNSPSHYTSSPSGVECIQVTEHMNFCRGNATKYIWRAGEKNDEIEDLRKAIWYLNREIERLQKAK